MISSLWINISYIVAAALFIIGLKFLSHPSTARKGNTLSALGMFIAVVVTLASNGIMDYRWILAGIAIGTVIGVFAAQRVAMTAMPEMVALLNGFGGIASLLVGAAVYIDADITTTAMTFITVMMSIFIGGITFSGSIIAWGKLSQKLPGQPLQYKGQQIMNLLLLAGVVAACLVFFLIPDYQMAMIITISVLSLILGITTVIPIGGADMPVVIALLNSYSGLAACAAGFAIENILLIVAGALVGASGIILTMIMCKAMNRSLSNVLFSGFGATGGSSKEVEGEVHPVSAEDAYYLLEAAGSVAIVPGYGLAVAQAQHTVRELGELLEKNGAEVRYAIHPVAGRMPGHMNVLLAEANVPYEQLVEMDDINAIMDTVDVCLVIGANDVVNPAAREDETSPIYGMPIINVDHARTVIVMKRSMGAGFSGIQNPLFYKQNTRMLFGDAKATLQGLVAEFKES